MAQVWGSRGQPWKGYSHERTSSQGMYRTCCQLAHVPRFHLAAIVGSVKGPGAYDKMWYGAGENKSEPAIVKA